ncbi:hypothetical protein DC439_22570 [Agrobacterium tumefaciens]|nr:hypothetical protein DC439_22570 [Agrobacterium tumefaciens]
MLPGNGSILKYTPLLGAPPLGEIRWRTHPFHGQGVRRLSISPLEGEMSGRTEGVSPEQDG